MKHVYFTRGRYVVRVTVPENLRLILGKRELVEPLGGDKKTAERMAHGVIAGFLAKIEDAKETLAASRPNLSTAAKAHYRAELEADDRERAGVGTASVAELNAVTMPRRASLLRLVSTGQIVGDEAEALIGYAADTLASKGIAPGGIGAPSKRRRTKGAHTAPLFRYGRSILSATRAASKMRGSMNI